MASKNFALALSRVLVYEGGYSNHPADPGGPTMRGIIQREYDAYRKKKGLETRSVRSISDQELTDIYHTTYWLGSRCDELPAGLDFCVFDAAVNSGPAQAGKWLQRALRGLYSGSVDGIIGDQTIAAARGEHDVAAVINDFCDQRLAMLRSLKTWGTFGKGWSARVAGVRAQSLELAGEIKQAPASLPIEAEGMARAPVSETSISSVVLSKDGLAASVPVVTAALNAAANPGPLSWAVAIAVVLGAVAAIYVILKSRRSA